MFVRSRVFAIAALVAVGAGVVVFALRNQRPSDSQPKSTRRPPVWVIGLDGADWKYLDELMASGAMPELQRLVREGRYGVLKTEQPPLSPLLWTTMMTGVSPLEHRILDFARRRPGDGVPEPITSSERRVPAVWNMAAGTRRKVVVLGLWATHPAETVNGLMVADRFFSFLHPDEAPAGSVAPAERMAWAKERLRAAETAADIVALRAYLPWLDERGLKRETGGDPYADPVNALRRIVVETATYDALFRDAVSEIDPDLAILYLQGTDSVGHAFARYAPPALPGVDDSDVARFGGVPEAYFRHVDELLGTYARLARQRGARLLLVSDHGFRWGDDRPVGLSSSAHGTAAKWHREAGIWLLWGPGVRSGDGAAGGVRQVCATILDLLDLPPGVGLAGPSLAVGAIPHRVGPARAAVDYRRAFRPMSDDEARSAAPSAGAASGDEALAALRALGYVAGDEAGGGNHVGDNATAGITASTRTAASFDNEGLILRAENRTDEARNAFESALLLSPADASAAWNLSELLRDQPAERERSDRLLLQALAGGLADGADALGNRVLHYAASGDRERAQRLLDEGLRRMPREARLWLLAGRLLLESEQCAPALRDFELAASLAPDRAEAYAAVGIARLCLGNTSGAADALRRSLALDPNQPQLRSRLAELGG